MVPPDLASPVLDPHGTAAALPGADEPEARLEAALERIARQVAAPDPVAREVAVRLDAAIATLRSALDE